MPVRTKQKRIPVLNLSIAAFMFAILIAGPFVYFSYPRSQQHDKEPVSEKLQLHKISGENKTSGAALFLAIGLPAFALVLVSGLFFNRNLKQQTNAGNYPDNPVNYNNLTKELDDKKKELASVALDMARSYELMIVASKQIRKILPNAKEENKAVLLDVIKKMESTASKDGWIEFEKQFEQYHEPFFNVLAELYPDLTPTEKKVCCFLRLNMTTKDIATITSRSPRTIDYTRNSIRKKMDLSSETNLSSFLLSI